MESVFEWGWTISVVVVSDKSKIRQRNYWGNFHDKKVFIFYCCIRELKVWEQCMLLYYWTMKRIFKKFPSMQLQNVMSCVKSYFVVKTRYTETYSSYFIMQKVFSAFSTRREVILFFLKIIIMLTHIHIYRPSDTDDIHSFIRMHKWMSN